MFRKKLASAAATGLTARSADHLRRILRRIRVVATPRRIMLAAGVLIACHVVVYTTIFFWPRTLHFTYGASNCITNPVFLPEAIQLQNSQSFELNVTPDVTIGDLTLYSHRTCVTPITAPSHSSSETASLALWGSALSKNITITVAERPKIHARLSLDAPVASTEPLVFGFSAADHTFDYRLAANQHTTDCNKTGTDLHCPLDALQLAQATRYEVALERTFRDKPIEKVFTRAITTVEPVQIISSSVAPGEKVFGAPTELTLTLNKPASKVAGLKLYRLGQGNTRQELATNHTIEGATIKAQLAAALPRLTEFELTVADIQSSDKGHLAVPFVLPFRTSGGPQVSAVSIGSSKVQPGAPITLTFDSAFAANQAFQNHIKVNVGDANITGGITVRGKQVVITPALGRCSIFSIHVVDGLKNETGVSGGSGWQFSSRTVCQSTFSIGTSVKGRPITAYKFGSGASTVVYIGTVHGNEKSSTAVLQSWINHLEANFDKIPANRTLVVIPNLNPDGYAANTRTNANNVDLNRNFAANSWKSGVTMPDGSFNAQGGGPRAHSEPESQAIVNYLSAVNPRFVATYHAIGPLVAANEVGDSLAQAKAYGKKVGYPAYGNEGSGEFAYDTTGALEDWLRDKRGVPAIIVELSSRTANEFSRHQSALWQIAQL